MRKKTYHIIFFIFLAFLTFSCVPNERGNNDRDRQNNDTSEVAQQASTNTEPTFKQPTIKEILPTCKTINDITKSFVREKERNEEAIKLITHIYNFQKADINSFNKSLDSLSNYIIKQLTNKKFNNVSTLNLDFLRIIKNTNCKLDNTNKGSECFKEIKLEFACATAKYVHKYYLVNQNQIPKKLKKHQDFYKGTTKKTISTANIIPDGTKHTENIAIKIHELDKRVKALEKGTGGWLIILGFIICLLAFFLLIWSKLKILLEDKLAELIEEKMSERQTQTNRNNINDLDKVKINSIIQKAVDDAVNEKMYNMNNDSYNNITREDLNNLRSQIIQSVDRRLEKLEQNQNDYSRDAHYPKPIRNQEDYNRRNEKSVSVSELGKLYYSPQANKNGLFYTAQFSEYEDNSKLFLIQVSRTDPDKALFTVNPKATMLRRAFNDPHGYLSAACTLKGGNSFNRITDSQAGIAIKEDGNWRVTKKAIISYI